MATENELEIRAVILELNAKIREILQSNNGDIVHHNSDEFFKIVTKLEHVNSTRHAPKIHGGVSGLIDQCHIKPENRHKYEELLQITQQFIDSINL